MTAPVEVAAGEGGEREVPTQGPGRGINDLRGRRFARLLVVEPTDARTAGGNVLWLCRCDCGASTLTIGPHLRSGNTRSCGCLMGESRSRNMRELQERQRARRTAP